MNDDDDRSLTVEEYNFRLNLKICIGYSLARHYNDFLALHPLRTDPAWLIFYGSAINRQLEFQM